MRSASSSSSSSCVFLSIALVLCALVLGGHSAMELDHQTSHVATVFPVSQPIITYWNEDDGGNPVECGVAFPDFEQFWTLDYTAAGQSTERFVFNYPTELPFVHLQVDWNPLGHPGGMSESTTLEFLTWTPDQQLAFLQANGSFFGVPHFDVHFHMKSVAYVENITCSGGFPPCAWTPEEQERFMDPGPLSYYPKTYFLDPTAAVPAMGSHHERNVDKERDVFMADGEFIYGSYDGEILFWEPMISMAQFQAVRALAISDPSGEASQTFSIALPEDYIVDGYYPRAYTVSYYEDEAYFTVALDRLVSRRASGPLAPSTANGLQLNALFVLFVSGCSLAISLIL